MPKFQTPRSEAEVFADLEKMCTSQGYIHVLAAISVRDNLIVYSGHFSRADLEKSYTDDRTISTEFMTLMGLMVKAQIDLTVPTSTQMKSLLHKTKTLLDELHECLNAPMMEAMTKAFAALQSGNKEIPSPFSGGSVLREPIFYGGQSAYDFQYHEFSKDRYANDSNWLAAIKGFQISDCHSVSAAIKKLLPLKIRRQLDQIKNIGQDLQSFLPGFTFTVKEIAAEANITESLASEILSAFTISKTPTNGSFVSLGDFNIVQACPILKISHKEYVILESYCLLEAMYDSPFYWMATDKAYKGTAFNNRGAFTETFTNRRMAAAFGAEYVFSGVDIFKGGERIGEIDVLVLFADRAIVVQCKSKKMTLEARKGNDFQLRDDFKKSVQDAYDQAFLCANSLLDANLRFTCKNGNNLIIPKLSQIYPVCVVSDHYPALSVQAREFLKFQKSEIIMPPLVADVFLVDVLSEMLASPLYFLSYLNRRVNYGHKIQSIQELSILGYHLSNNLWVNKDTDMVMIADDYSLELDTAMMVRRTGVAGAPTPKGILTILSGTLIGKILKSTESRPDAGLVDFGFMILTLNAETLDQLNKGLSSTSEATRRDGQTHDFTLAFNDGDAGITIHCSTLPNSQALDYLADHCKKRKYIHQANNWFGLLIRADDGLPKFALRIPFPWKSDERMDELTKGMFIKSK